MGANDGIRGSNTLYFEGLGWTGLLVEADPRVGDELKANRPNAVIELCAIDTVAGVKRFSLMPETVHSGFLRETGNVVDAPCVPLSALFARHDITHVDVMSIDVEGTELDVWASRGAVNPTVVIIEWQTWMLPDRTEEIRKTFAADGYREAAMLGCNLIFVRNG